MAAGSGDLLAAAAGLALAGVAAGRQAPRARSARMARRAAVVWLLQTALAALLLFLLWHPALSVATLRPQQNIVAVVVDDSASMAHGGRGRIDPQRRGGARSQLRP